MSSKKFYIDYRFIVTAKDKKEAIEKVEDFLPDSTSNIWFTIIEAKLKEKVKRK